MNNRSTILKSVSKPGRYSGGEYNQIIKDKSKIKARWAFCFPDSYEIGMSNLGVRILYGALNKEEDVWCERAYMPWLDMLEKMQKYDLPFILLSDPELQAIQAYGVWQEKKLYGKVSMGVVRTTFIIDEQGNIEKVMPKVKPDTNAAEILSFLAGE